VCVWRGGGSRIEEEGNKDERKQEIASNWLQWNNFVRCIFAI
jgi:hypothetical protein